MENAHSIIDIVAAGYQTFFDFVAAQPEYGFALAVVVLLIGVVLSNWLPSRFASQVSPMRFSDRWPSDDYVGRNSRGRYYGPYNRS